MNFVPTGPSNANAFCVMAAPTLFLLLYVYVHTYLLDMPTQFLHSPSQFNITSHAAGCKNAKRKPTARTSRRPGGAATGQRPEDHARYCKVQERSLAECCVYTGSTTFEAKYVFISRSAYENVRLYTKFTVGHCNNQSRNGGGVKTQRRQRQRRLRW